MIRKYQPSDLDDLLTVWYQASLIAHDFLDKAFFASEREAIQSQYLPNTETWVYEVDAKVVGFIALLENEVGAIFVHPIMQGKGIGKALMDHARHPRDFLELDVFKANKIGRAFYDRYGFKVIGEHLHEGTGQPLLRMKLDS